MKKLVFLVVISLFFALFPRPAFAGGDDSRLAATSAQTITLPYEFEPYEIITETETLDVDLADVSFINQVGSIGLTFFSILDNFAILGIFVVLMLAIGVVFWVWSLVTETPHTTTLRVFDAAEVAANIYDTQLELEEGQIERSARLYRDPAYWTGQRALVQGRRRRVAQFKSASRKAKTSFKRFSKAKTSFRRLSSGR
jgi:hypothetical protein